MLLDIIIETNVQDHCKGQTANDTLALIDTICGGKEQ